MKYFLRYVLWSSMFFSIALSQWTQTNGPDGGIVKYFSVNQSNGHIFAGTKGGVYRSTDDGVSWTWASTTLPVGLDVTAIHSFGSDTYVYGVPTASLGMLYHSTDEGVTWTNRAGTGLPLIALINAFLVSGGKVLAGTGGFGSMGVFASTDHGATWTSSSTGLPTDYTPGVMTMVGSKIFTGSAIGSTSKGVYVSTDGGVNWSAVNTGFPSPTDIIAFTSSGSTLFAATLLSGVYKTTNDGGNWTKISPTSPINVLGATALAATATNLFIGAGAMFRADANGAGWDTVTTGLPARDAGTAIKAIAVKGSAIVTSFANQGIWRSTNNGATWIKSNTGLRAGNIWGLYFNGSSLYAGAVTTGFFRTSDNGDNWTEINTGIDLRQNGYYNFITAGSYLLGGGGLYGMFRSSDGGDTWVAGTLGSPAYGFIKDGSDIYTGVVGNVAKSTDNGASWTFLNPGLLSYIAALAVWKYDSTILVGCSAGFKRSTDNGATWTGAFTGLPTFGGFGSFTQINSTVYVAHSQGVYQSTNHGETWSTTGSGLTGGATALHHRNNDLFAGTSQGVYRYTGSSWTAINTGFPTLPYVTILTSNDEYLFAGTNPNSVWRRPLSEVLAVDEVSNEIPSSFLLQQNYPNPFNPTTKFELRIAEIGMVKLKIYDVLGREVATLVNEELHPGVYSATWDASGQPSGIYYGKLTAGDNSQTIKLLLTK